MTSKRATLCLALVLGAVSTTTQVMAVRELLVAFTGNELTVAVTLALWLAAAGAGSILSPRLAARGAHSVGVCLIMAGLASLAQVISVRAVLPAVAGAGEMAGPTAIAAVSLVGIVPAAALFGAAFGALVAQAGAAGFTRPTAITYGVEALGSAAAGLALSAWLVGALNAVAIMAFAALVALSGGAWLALRQDQSRRCTAAVTLGIVGVGLAVVVWQSPAIDLASRRAEWKPLDVLRTVESPYGNIVVTGLDGSFQFFETGVLAFTVPDARYAEECAHLPLLLHPGPHNVLVLGGAGSGIVREVLKHPSVKTVDWVELDPAAATLVRNYAPQGWLDGTARASVNSHFGDGREYVARAMTMYDAIIVGAGMPTSLEVNRYYTREFFRTAEKLLERDGILAVRVASSGASPGPETAALVASIANALRAVFPHVVAVPGDYVHLLASPGLDLRAEVPRVVERLARRGIATSFATEFVLTDRLEPLRLAMLDSTLALADRGQVNSDDDPAAFALAISLWQRQAAGGHALSRFTAWLDTPRCVALLAGLGLVVAALGFAVPRFSPRAFPSLLALYCVGLATMFTEILVILAFQIARGYIYSRLAGLVAAYMAGVGVVATLVGRGGAVRARSPRGCSRHLALIVYVALVVPPLAVPRALHFLGNRPRSVAGWAADALFIGIAALAGAAGGAAFSAAARALAAHTRSEHKAAAAAYAVDLAGAAVAGITTGLVIVPALGISRSALAVAASTLAVLAVAAIAARPWATSRPR